MPFTYVYMYYHISQLIEADMAQVMQREYEKATEIELQKEKERYFQSVHYQQQLESQLEEQERKKQEAYEEFLKEKLMIDEICRKIYEEDQRYSVKMNCKISWTLLNLLYCNV